MANFPFRKSRTTKDDAEFLAGTSATPVGGSKQDPRKVGTGSTYVATGLIPQSPNYDSESGSSQPTRVIELVPELVSPYSRLLAYTRMQNDAGVDVSLRAVKTPVLGAEFFMQPHSDDPQDQLIAQFCWDNLAAGMSSPFLNSLEDILRMYEDGVSVLEKVYELREWSPSAKGANSKTYTMLKKLGPRPQSTLGLVNYDDNGGPVSITHNAIRAGFTTEEVILNIEDLLVFTFNRKGGDIMGRSILRTAYPHWYYKTHFYKIDAIQKERHSLGIPKGKLLPGYNASDRTILRTLLRNLRSNEESFMLLTPNVDVEFAEIKGNLVDVLSSAEHHNMMILLNVLAQFLGLGIDKGSGGGGRATGATGADMFMKSLKYVANYIADVINMYLIPELVVWNFPTTNFPKLAVRNIGETRDLQMFASAISNLLAQDGITMDDPTEAWLRRVFDMPQQDPATSRQLADTAPTDNTNGKQQQGASKIGKGQPGKPANAPQ